LVEKVWCLAPVKRLAGKIISKTTANCRVRRETLLNSQCKGEKAHTEKNGKGKNILQNEYNVYGTWVSSQLNPDVFVVFDKSLVCDERCVNAILLTHNKLEVRH